MWKATSVSAHEYKRFSKAADLPFGKFRDKGIPIDNVSNYDSSKEDIVCVTSQSDLNLYRIAFVTKMSMMKVVSGGEFDVAKKTVAATIPSKKTHPNTVA